MVGTTKKSTDTNCLTWFSRNVRQVCEGGFRGLTTYLETVDWDMSIIQLEQFTVYSWGSPAGVGNAHFPDEFSDLSFSIGSSWATALPAPIKMKAPTMPTNDCFWLDDQ